MENIGNPVKIYNHQSNGSINRLKISTTTKKRNETKKFQQKSKSTSHLKSSTNKGNKSSSTSLSIRLSIPKPKPVEKSGRIVKPNLSGDNNREKKDGYNVHSKRSLLKDIKNTAINSLTQVRHGFNSISTMLMIKSSSKLNGENQYEEMNDEQSSTPIKLYSPFTIETPPPMIMIKQEDRQRLRQQLFTSPRNQIKNDIENLQTGIEYLNLMANKIVPNQYRKQIEHSNSNDQNDDDDDERKQSIHQSTKTTKRLLMFQSKESLI
ncbi:hypothetical protein DERP_007938 [Dermatophagoides pteronyssinus]|uniref:Uncharacterized protein LOC113794648 n=2 Tax=Dermatophagoides pteronyssinus TaxID=6956 RepID=A0A6P6Y528_DERPT|nr:uncharacterized protein LOC113794648 [Dermatophagoides pteronyssinus]KAH9413462.1 hypothetical protein DERP_007938 [Dermatophagoides pteronyssinus]